VDDPICDLRYSLPYALRGGREHHAALGVPWWARWATHEVDHRKRDSRYLSRSSSRFEEICRNLRTGHSAGQRLRRPANGTAHNAVTWGWDPNRDRTGNASGNSSGTKGGPVEVGGTSRRRPAGLCHSSGSRTRPDRSLYRVRVRFVRFEGPFSEVVAAAEYDIRDLTDLTQAATT